MHADHAGRRLQAEDGSLDRAPTSPAPGRGLSARLLGLAVLFMLLGEVLIFAPSVARFRLVYLERMIGAAHLAALTVPEPPASLPPDLEATLLRHVGALAVTLWKPAVEVMLGRMREAAVTYDLRDATAGPLILDALATLWPRPPRVIRVVAPSPVEPDIIVDVVLDETQLRAETRDYAMRILVLSLLLSGMVTLLLFMALRRVILLPLAAITARISAFREMPEDAGLDHEPDRRTDEIGIVERELGAMQRGLRLALKQKTRLAALGAAVAEVSHDLKNILASAVLISDRLEASADADVKELAPRLIRVLERAVRLCTTTLVFAREQPTEPHLARFDLAPLVDEVGDAVTVGAPMLLWVNEVRRPLPVLADRDQLYRVLLNLGRNSREAIGRRPGRVVWRAGHESGTVAVTIEDDGIGVPPTLRSRLFSPLATSKEDGSGLGLAICREIMRSHGGGIELRRTGEKGTLFTLTLPDRVLRGEAGRDPPAPLNLR